MYNCFLKAPNVTLVDFPVLASLIAFKVVEFGTFVF